MMYGYGSMFGGFSVFGLLGGFLVILDLALLAVFLWQKITK